jgi:shikimate kinase
VKDIILTGPKHSGKTSAGKALASLYSCEFIDLDELILQLTGKTPRQLFIIDPDVFRKAEAETAEELFNTITKSSDTVRRIIATGGGIIDNPEALAELKRNNSTIVFLNIITDTAWKRINNSFDGMLPPGLGTMNPQEAHRSQHERRAELYQQLADIVIYVDGKTPEEIAQEIQKSIQENP